MIAVRLLTLCAAWMAMPQVQAAPFAFDPLVPRDGDNGVSILDKTSPLRGEPQAPQPYVVMQEDGQLAYMNGTEVISYADQIQDAFTPKENEDLRWLGWPYNIELVFNANDIYRQWKQGTVQKVAWPGSYWPTYQDGINYRWDRRNPSPAEKYAKANGLNVKEFMDKVSAESGIDASPKHAYKECTWSLQCGWGGKCAIREGKRSGYCIPTWSGLCHAWAPAAMFENEPRCPVTVNGVTFKPMDIKALVTQLYDGGSIPVIYGGAIYFGGDNNQKDAYGRYKDLSHRDVSPAMFHIALGNIVGRLGRNFLLDVDADDEVWNQPVRSYRFTNVEVLNPDAAAKRFFNIPSYSVFNKDAVKVHYVTTEFKYVAEGYEDGALSGRIDQYTETKTYKYLLEVDANGTILGGEWVGNSRYDHPDAMWIPLRQPDANMTTSLGISAPFVNDLIARSSSSQC